MSFQLLCSSHVIDLLQKKLFIKIYPGDATHLDFWSVHHFSILQLKDSQTQSYWTISPVTVLRMLKHANISAFVRSLWTL